MALSLYRKYRPEVFADVVGQKHVEKTLINAVADGNVAHAYLFCGPRGTGKTTTARLLAKALLCENDSGAEPDGTCPRCREIAQGTHPDVFELDAASRTGVDNVREEIIGRVNFAPTRGRYKIYIIDEVHMLSTAAFNALLKTLEEPPEHVVFVLCTTDPHKVPETIQSRCQRFDFRRFSVEEIVGYLERICSGEKFEYEPEALEFIAAKSAGGMRDATTSLEQVGVYTEGKITLEEAARMFGQIDSAALFEIAGFIARRDTAACFTWIDSLVGKGVDLAQFARDLTTHMRNLYVTLLTGGADGIVACTAAQLGQYQQQAREFGGVDRLARALDTCGALVAELRNSADPRLSVEIAMTRLAHADSELTIESLAERIEILETRVATGDVSAPRFQDAPAQGFVSDESLGQASAQPPVSADVVRKSDGSAIDDGVTLQTSSDQEPEPCSDVTTKGADGMTPERLLAALLTVVKRGDTAVGALLNGVSLAEEDGKYHLLFPTGAEFAMRVAGGSDAKALVSHAFEEVFGREVEFDYRIGSFVGLAHEAQSVSAESLSMDNDDGAAPERASLSDRPEGADDFDLAEPEITIDMHVEPDFDAQPQATREKPIDDETAANIADALSAFGKGVKVREIDEDK
jgi:DNA polymerase-3 subunit gamma/tau